MNQTDRDRMSRLYACMVRWPWWNRPFCDCIMAISRCDDESMDPDGELDNLEALIALLGEGP